MKKQTSLLCPQCRRIISRDEQKCPHCGLTFPGSLLNRLVMPFFANDRIIPIVIAINALMYCISLLMDIQNANLSVHPLYFLSPSNISLLISGATGTVPIDRFGRWWTIISANYLHAGLLHIVMNMAALNMMGKLIVREYGTYRMITIYAISGIIGYIVSYLAGIGFSIGASAAICGLIGAALYFGKSRGGIYGQAVYKQVSGWIISMFLVGIIISGINNWAHIGGLLSGVALGFIFGYRERTPEKMLHRIIAYCCIVLTISVLLWSVGTCLLGYYQF